MIGIRKGDKTNTASIGIVPHFSLIVPHCLFDKVAEDFFHLVYFCFKRNDTQLDTRESCLKAENIGLSCELSGWGRTLSDQKMLCSPSL